VNGTGPVAELIGDRIKLILAVDRQITALVLVLPNQTIDILRTAPLPKAMRAAKVYIYPRVGCQLCMSGHLLALVIRQRLRHGMGWAMLKLHRLASTTNRELRSTSTPTAERLLARLMRFLSQ